MRFRLLAALAATVLSTGLGSAQPKAVGPTVEVRLRSVNDLADTFEYVAGAFGQEEAGRQVRGLVKTLTADGKGIEGIDPKKPMGAYATLSKDVVTSPVVVLIPIADQEQLFKALQKRFEIAPEKNDDGTFKVAVPFLNELTLRFANGYVYVSQKARDLDPQTLIKPAAYFAKDDGAVASVVVHIDRIPAELKTVVLGQLELGINEARKKDGEKEGEAEKRFKNLALDAALAGFKGLNDDGKDLSVKLFADAKSDTITAEVVVTATSGSPTAKTFAALGTKTSLPAGIVAAANPVSRGNAKIAAADSLKKDYVAAVDALLAEAAKQVPADQEDAFKQVVAAVGPTIKSGELDVASTFIGPDAKGHYRFIGAVGVKEGKGIETVLKALVKQYGQFVEGDVTFKFDEEAVGDFTLHRIDLKHIDDTFDRTFGTNKIWLATSDKVIVASIEPDGDTIRKGLKAKAVPVPIVSTETAVAKLLPLAQPDSKPDRLKATLKEVFGDGPTTGKDVVAFRVEGGDRLGVTLTVKGKAVRALAEMNKHKEK
jgi:hypothetical protein